MPPTSISTTSLCRKNRLGFLKAPTPDGVPVITAVYAGMVVPMNKVSCPATLMITFMQMDKYEHTLTYKAQNLRRRKDHITIDLHVLHDFPIDSCCQT